MRSILLPEAFVHVFEPYRGKRVRLFSGPGNVGDKLIEAGTRQLFQHYSITEVKGEEPADVVMYGGGGNMGTLYDPPQKEREKAVAAALKLNVPFVILPQSWNAVDKNQNQASKLFAREARSLLFCPSAILAPDLALGYSLPETWVRPAQKAEIGFFFRKDKEAALRTLDPCDDPAAICSTIEQYINLAASYTEIHTDRLHFAISGMLAKTKVFLYPNSYPKNKSVYLLWLIGRGCEWRDTNEISNF